MAYDVTPASPLPVRIALDACVAGSVPLRADPAAIGAAHALLTDDDALEIAIVGPSDATVERPHPSDAPHPRTLNAAEALTGEAADRVRATRLSSVRVAAKDVRDGRSDVFVATGPPGPALAAAQFSFGLVQGATAPVLAWLLDTDAAPLVMIGGDSGPATALLGEIASRTLLGVGAPRVGRLSWPSGDSAASLVTGSADHDVLITAPATAVALLQVLAATGRPAPPTLVLGLTALAVIDVAGTPPPDLLVLAVRAVRAHVQPAAVETLGEFVRQRREAAGLKNRVSDSPDSAESQM